MLPSNGREGKLLDPAGGAKDKDLQQVHEWFDSAEDEKGEGQGIDRLGRSPHLYRPASDCFSGHRAGPRT